MNRWLRPRVVLPVLTGALLVAALLTPVSNDNSDTYLTTRSLSMNGARGIREVFEHLGRKTSERIIPFAASLDSDAIYLVLGTPIEPSRTEVHALLEGVRRGARAVLIPVLSDGRENALADSLGIRASDRVPYALHAAENGVPGNSPFGSEDPVDTVRELFGLSGARSFHRYLEAVPASDSDSNAVWPVTARTFLSVTTPRGVIQPEIATLPIGRGTAMVIADPSFLRNDIVKKTAGAMLAVRMMERLDYTGRAPLVFDEYHQGFGTQDTMMDVVEDALTKTTWGRVGLQIALAALLYLAMVGVRPIPPVSRARLERRSPLEHVGALSRAYESIGATKLAAQRLVRGLRRRHPLGGRAQGSDAEYLTFLRLRLPAMSGDIDTLKNALTRETTAEQLLAVGSAIDHIERGFTT